MTCMIEKEEVLNLLGNRKVRICDCRFQLGVPEAGKKAYLDGHIPGSVYFDLENDLSGKVNEHGGRHPIPDIDAIRGKLEAEGIGNDTLLIAYDGGEDSFAARFAWLLNYLGHQSVRILNGGYESWEKAGYPVETKQASFDSADYHITINPSILASYQKVKEHVENRADHIVLIDSREGKRYRGEEEPIDKKAGHIPGAINKVWLDVFEKGHVKEPEKLKKHFSDINKDREIIVYCGSGVTACSNYVALREAGYENVRVYAGSFSDWISYPDNPIE